MKLDDVRQITVIGAGTMGHGIAEVAALSGFEVVLNDASEEALRKGLETIQWSLNKLSERGFISQDQAERAAGHLTGQSDFETAVSQADVVIEAAPERMAVKKEIFSRLDRSAPAHAILATNTSSLSITEIGASTSRPGQVVGMHFFNPPVRMALIEVIRGERTSDQTMDLMVGLSEKFGKTPVRVEKDVHAFVVNRINVGYGIEAMEMLSRGDATAEEIDSRMKFHEGMPMGPLELMDFGGLDILYDFLKEMNAPIPSVVQEKVDKGQLGRKTGKGFYDYGKGGVQYSQEAGQRVDPTVFYALMANEAAWLIDNDVCSAETIDLALQLGMGFPEGLLKRADRLGLDRLVACLDRLYAQSGNDRYRTSRLLREMVDAGKTGQEAGEGFHTY